MGAPDINQQGFGFNQSGFGERFNLSETFACGIVRQFASLNVHRHFNILLLLDPG